MRLIISCLFLLVFSSANAQFTKANIQASGLTCAMCTKAINNALKELAFVQSVESDISSSSFNVAFRSGKSVDIDRIRKAVEDAGFSVSKMKLTGNFDGVAVGNDEHVTINGSTFHFLKVSDQTLKGQREITMVDKNFIGAKEFKKFSSATKMECVHTGKAASCCNKNAKPAERIFHVTI